MRIDFSVFGDEKVERDLLGMRRRAADLRPALNRVRDLVFAGQRKNFASRGAWFDAHWPPLAAATIARKGSSTPLVRTGALAAAVAGGRGRKSSVTPFGVSIGLTSPWYAHFAQSGTTREPARKIGGISDSDARKALALVRDYVVNG